MFQTDVRCWAHPYIDWFCGTWKQQRIDLEADRTVRQVGKARKQGGVIHVEEVVKNTLTQSALFRKWDFGGVVAETMKQLGILGLLVTNGKLFTRLNVVANNEGDYLLNLLHNISFWRRRHSGWILCFGAVWEAKRQ